MHPGAMMQSSLQHRRGRSLSSSAKERDDDLVLFHEMQKRERERKNSIHSPSDDDVETPVVTKSVSSSLYRMPTSTPSRTKGAEDLFTSDWDKNDYDWLLTPPGTPLVPTLDQDLPGPGFSLNGTPSVRSLAALKTSRLVNSRSEASRTEPSSRVVRGNLGLQQPNNSSSSLSHSTTSTSSRRSLAPSSNTVSRPSTPSSHTSARPSTLSSNSVTSLPSNTVARPSTPSSNTVARPSTPSSNSVARPSTPGTSTGPRISLSSSNTATRPSTPSGRASIPSSNRPTSSSRPSTPVRRPSTPNLHQSNPPNTIARSSSVSKASALPSRSAATSRASSPTTKNRAWQPQAMPGFSLEPPPNLRTSMPDRSNSNSRGTSVGSRPGGPTTARTTQAEAPDASMRPRRQSSSPLVTRGRLSSDSQNGDRTISRNGKAFEGAVEVVMGSKLVERTVRSRKPVVSAQEEQSFVPNSQVKRSVRATPLLKDVKSTIPAVRDSSGFGRNLSKKSLDMALRHMDIRRSTPSGFRSFMSNIPASSLYSVRSSNGPGRSTSSAAQSPMATSSNASSEHSMSIVPDPEGSELGDEIASEKGSKSSPASQPDSVFSLSKERRITNWLGSPDYRDDGVEIMQLFRQGIERFSGPESPLVCQHGGAAECENCTLELR